MALTWSQRRNPDSEHPSIRLPLILEETQNEGLAVANGDILPAKGVANISFKTENGYDTLTGVLHVSGLDRKLILVPHLPQRVLQYGY